MPSRRLLLLRWLLLLIPFAWLATSRAADERADDVLKALAQRLEDPKADRERLRLELLAFQRSFPGTAEAVKAAEYVRQLPSPLDRIDPKTIPALERFDWQPPELVAVLGEHRGRHASMVYCVAYSGNGKWVASGGASTSVRIWDAATLRLHAHLGATSSISAIAFSRDSNRLGVAVADGSVRIWDMSASPPKLEFAFTEATSPLYAIAFSPDGKHVAAGGFDLQLRVWDLTTKEGKVISATTAHAEYIGAIAYAPDGRTMASGGHDGTVKIFDIVDGAPKEKAAAAKEHEKGVQALAYSPDGKLLASGGADGFLRLLNINTGKGKFALKGHGGSDITSLSFAAGGKVLASGGGDGTIHIWDTTGATLRPRTVLEGHATRVTGIAFGPDGKALASGSYDWTVRLWELAGTKVARKPVMKGHLSAVYALAFSPEGKSLASGGADTTARIWDVTLPEPRSRNVIKGDAFQIYSMAYTPDNKLALVGNNVLFRTWEPVTGKPARKFEGHAGAISSIALSGDGRHAVTACSDKTARVWDMRTGNDLRKPMGHEVAPSSAAISPDGTRGLSAGGGYLLDEKGRLVIKDGAYVYTDCRVRYWDISTGDEIHNFSNYTKPVYTVAFAPDGKSAASGGADGTIRLLSFTGARPEETKSLQDRGGVVFWLTYSPDGKQLASLGPMASVTLWDVATGKKTKEWTVPEYVRKLAFSPDGRHLALSLDTGVVYVLRLSKAEPEK
jgi:WD40 repeat protein